MPMTYALLHPCEERLFRSAEKMVGWVTRCNLAPCLLVLIESVFASVSANTAQDSRIHPSIDPCPDPLATPSLLPWTLPQREPLLRKYNLLIGWKCQRKGFCRSRSIDPRILASLGKANPCRSRIRADTDTAARSLDGLFAPSLVLSP